MSSKYDVPLPSPVGALIAFYEGSSHGLSDEQQMTLMALYNLHHAEAALARVEAAARLLVRDGAVVAQVGHPWPGNGLITAGRKHGGVGGEDNQVEITVEDYERFYAAWDSLAALVAPTEAERES